MFKIKPCRNYDTRIALKSLSAISPSVMALEESRRGVRKAIKSLKKVVMGVISIEDAGKIQDEITVLQAEADYALVYALAVCGHATEPLSDLMEYRSFENVVLPERTKEALKKKVVFSSAIIEAIARHTNAMDALKQKVSIAPRYRKIGHDYFEDMVENVVRMSMRPALGRFAAQLEENLGWSRDEKAATFGKKERH